MDFFRPEVIHDLYALCFILAFLWCMHITYFIENMVEPGITFIYFVAFVDRIPALSLQRSYLNTIFQFYQVVSVIPKYLVIKQRNTEPLENELYTRNNVLFQLDDSTQIKLEKAKTRDIAY